LSWNVSWENIYGKGHFYRGASAPPRRILESFFFVFALDGGITELPGAIEE
jgi:hypothetical protein